MAALPITRVVLYKHGIGYFEREGLVEGQAVLTLTFKQAEVSDVLKSLTVLDLNGGHVSSVSYDATKPLEQLLSEVALSIPDRDSLVSLLPQLRGARVALHSGVADPIEGSIIGIDTTERQTGDGIVHVVLLSVMTEYGEVRSVDLHHLAGLRILDHALKEELAFYLRTMLSAKKKDARTFSFFAQGQGQRTIRLSYTLGAPVWKATYRILLGEEGRPPLVQGWAVVDNMQDEDWENVRLSLISGLPVSFVHDLYTPRYIRRPEVKVQETTGVLPPEVEESMLYEDMSYVAAAAPADLAAMEIAPRGQRLAKSARPMAGQAAAMRSAVSSAPAQVRERKIGDLFEYEIEHPVTIRRNQSALVPIVLRAFEGRPVLLYNKQTRPANPMRSVEFKNTTGLTLEGGPVTVIEGGSYVGEAMLDTLKPAEQRLIPYAVELSVHVLDNVESHNDRVHRVVINRGSLLTCYQHVQQTTYHFNNKGDGEQVLYLEHPRPGGEWQLFDTPEPLEITENYWRFRLSLPAGKVTPFVVRQKLTLSQSFALADVADQQLALWIEQRYLDAVTAKVLGQVINLRQQTAALEEQRRRLDQERQAIHHEQTRIRENLQALGDRPAEKDLRERFVRTLSTQEDRLEQIEREQQQKVAAAEECRTKIQEVLARLELDAAVPG